MTTATSAAVAANRAARRGRLRAAAFAATAALSLALAACAAAPPERRVALNPAETAAAVGATRPTAARLVGVRTVALPDYAEDEKIYVAAEDGALRPADGVLWADDPDRAITRALAASLDAGLSAEALAEPWPRVADPDLEIAVAFDRLAADSTGRVTAEGEYQLIRARARRPGLTQERFALSAGGATDPADARRFSNIAAAHAQVIAELARRIADDIAAAAPGRNRR